MSKPRWYVYMHKNKINNKIYIGQTKDIQTRWSYNGEMYRGSVYFYHAIQKYGWNNFEHIILEENLTKEKADFWEKYYIDFYNTMDPKNGYNLKSGGLNSQLNDISKKKISNTKKSQYNNIEYKEKMKKLHRKIAGMPVICLDTGEIFLSSGAAAEWCGLKSGSSINRCCHHERQSAGKHPVLNYSLHWEFYEKKEVLNGTPYNK